MELVFIAISCAALIWLLARLGFRSSDGRMFDPLIRRHVPLGARDWPVGIQEENDDRRWGNRAARIAQRAVEPELRPTLQRVKPGVRVR